MNAPLPLGFRRGTSVLRAERNPAGLYRVWWQERPVDPEKLLFRGIEPDALTDYAKWWGVAIHYPAENGARTNA